MSRHRRPLLVAVAIAYGATVIGPSAYAAPKVSPGTTAKSRAAAAHLSDVDSAEKYYASMDYESANAIAERVLEARGLTHDQLVRATRVLAITYATLGKQDLAREAFTTLLSMDPDYQLDPNLSPRVTTPFLEARGYWRGQAMKPGIEVVATVHTSDSARLAVTTRDPAHVVTNVAMGYRWGVAGDFTTRSVAIGDGVNVVVPASPSPSETRLDYYVQGIDEHDNVVFEVGNVTAPKSAVVDAPVLARPVSLEPEKTPNNKSIFASPVFWTAAAVVVAGAVVGGIFLFRPKAPDSATLSGGADCGPEPCH